MSENERNGEEQMSTKFECGQNLCTSTEFVHQQIVAHKSDRTWNCKRQRQCTNLESMIGKEMNDECFNDKEEKMEILQLDGKPSVTGVHWRDQL